MSALGRIDAAFLAAPRHHRGTRRESTFENFVPTDDATSFLRKVFARVTDYIALQTLFGGVSTFGLQVFLADKGLTLRTLLPTFLGAFVAADVNVGRGEDICHLIEHVVDEFVGFRVAGTKHIVRNAPVLAHLVGPSGASKFGVGGQSGDHVTGQVDFGDYRDVTFGSVAHNVATFLLSVKSAVRATVVFAGVMTDHGLSALTPHCREARVALNINAPTLIVGEMPVKAVDVVEGEQVDEAFHAVDRHEVARHVKFHAAVAEARCIAHASRGNADGRFSFLFGVQMRKGFAQCLHTVECARIIGAGDGDLPCVHVDAVALSPQILCVGERAHRKRRNAFRFFEQRELKTGALEKILL